MNINQEETKMNISQFISKQQMDSIRSGLQGEEGKFFGDKIREMNNVINTMPKTYEQGGKGYQAIAYLHYFRGGMDWYITESDMEDEQHQAFGLANLGHGAELGYISIEELIANDAELDLYWVPATLSQIKQKAALWWTCGNKRD